MRLDGPVAVSQIRMPLCADDKSHLPFRLYLTERTVSGCLSLLMKGGTRFRFKMLTSLTPVVSARLRPSG